MAANGLRVAVLGRDGAALDDFEGALVDVGHEIRVELAVSPLAVGRCDVLIYLVAAGNVNPEPALAPEQELDQPVGVVPVGCGELRRAVYEGAVDRYLASGALHRDVQRLLCAGKEGGEKLAHRYETGVQLRYVLYRHLYPKKIHYKCVLLRAENTRIAIAIDYQFFRRCQAKSGIF